MNNQQTSTNKLQTLANKNRQTTNTRKTVMLALATLTAITLIGQYVMLGTAGLGRSISDLPVWFFIAEKSLWGLRGIVEIAVVIYVGMTITDDQQEQAALSWFKLALILLIVLTVGPVWIASTLGQSVTETISAYGVYVWGSALAGISAVMLWAVSYAYTVQPYDAGIIQLPFADYETMLATVGEAEQQARQALAEATQARSERDRATYELNGMRQAVEVLRFLPASAQVQIVALFADGRPDADSLAEAFGISASTVRGVLAKINSEVKQ